MAAAAAREAKRKKDELYFNYNMNSCIGHQLARLGRHKDAITYYTKAMESGEEGKVHPLIVARSKALSRLAQHEAARADAELVNKMDPDNFLSIENDAFTLYEQGDFEDSLVRHYQGLAKRKKPEYFYNGVKVGDETIQTCIGRKSGPMLGQKELGKTVIDIEFSRIDFENETDSERAHRMMNCERKERYFTERYLRRMAGDKLFLHKCLKDPDLSSGNQSHNEKLKGIIKETLDVINKRQETLMTRCPVYVLKNEEPQMSTIMQKIRRERISSARHEAFKMADWLIDEAKKNQMSKEIEKCLHFTDRALTFIAHQPNSLFNDNTKSELNDTIYRLIGELYLSMKTLVHDFSDDRNEDRILYMLGMHVNSKPSVEIIKKTVVPTIHDYRKYQRHIESKMELCVEPLEKTYLQHEISWCYALGGLYELSRKAAVLGYKTAKKAGSIDWCLNNAFLVIRADINQTNLDEAKISLKQAITMAKGSENMGCVAYFEQILELVDIPELMNADGITSEEKTMNEIINLMPTPEMRLEASTLLHTISNLAEKNIIAFSPSNALTKRASETTSRKSMRIHARAKRKTLMESGPSTKFKSILSKMKNIAEESRY